jgi:hypothetical protein
VKFATGFVLRSLPSLLISFVISSIGFSQGANVGSFKQPTSSSGFRVSLLADSLTAKYKFSDDLGVGSSEFKINSANGVALGYAYLPAYSFGWTGNISYFELRDGSSINLARLDLNLAYSFNSNLNFKFGPNIGKFYGPNIDPQIQSKVGYQVSFGVQATPNIGFDIGMTDIKFEEPIFGGKTEMDITGAEVALTATF